MTKVNEIEARLDAASPGPWRALTGAKQRSHQSAQVGAVFPMTLANNEHIIGKLCPWVSDADRALIVNAREDLEHLFEELRVAREHLRCVIEEQPGAVRRATEYLLGDR